MTDTILLPFSKAVVDQLPHGSTPLLVSQAVAEQFATVVIEVPRPSYFQESKTAMRVASHKLGGRGYGGPLRLYPERWKHIQTFYVFNLSRDNYYQAQSLTHHPHYSILRSELPDFERALGQFKAQHSSSKIKRITAQENFADEFLIVINDFDKFPRIKSLFSQIDDSHLLPTLLANGRLDANRGNWKMDFGFSCGQNLERDTEGYGITRPRLLDRTREPIFVEVQKDLSLLADIVSEEFELPLFHRVDDIHLAFAATVHPCGLYPAWRVAAHGPNVHVEVHEDSLNDSRPLMSPVGVLSRIYETSMGATRLTKIGYSRQSLHDAIKREHLLKPVVKRFKEWESRQPVIQSEVSSDLLKLSPNSDLPGVIEIPCHLERSVGVSPYIHAIIELQKLLDLSRHQCVGILYHCVTNESPFFFYSVFEFICSADREFHEDLRNKSPTELGLWFHSMIWRYISDKQNKGDKRAIPHRHQPHNGKRTSDRNIVSSIVNLIRLTDEYLFLDGKEAEKQYYHSKAVAILMMPANAGGCHACGGLTSQTLLYTLACVGLVPICVTRWGELAGTDTAVFLEREYGLGYSDGKGQQFLSCCVAASPGKCEQQVENRVCKWGRDEKEEKRKLSRKSNESQAKFTRFKDGIWPGQRLFEPVGNMLLVYSLLGHKKVKPPAMEWPHVRGKRKFMEEAYWDQPTRSSRKRVLGGNRRAKRGKLAKTKIWSLTKLLSVLPTPMELAFQAHCRPLYLSINNLLRDVLQEDKPVPNSRIIPYFKRRKGIRYSLLDSRMEAKDCSMVARSFSHARECRVDGSLHYAKHNNVEALSKNIFHLLSQPGASQQAASRDKSCGGDYYLIHDNNGRTQSKRLVIGVVKYISDTRVVFVHTNHKYYTDTMDYCYLDKP